MDYLKYRDDDWAEDGEPMHTMQSIPHAVILLQGHPTGSHKEIEDEVHDEQKHNNVEDLNGLWCYDGDGDVILATDYVEVGKDDEDEVVVWLDEAGPGRDVLSETGVTRIASMSISIRCVCLPSPDS